MKSYPLSYERQFSEKKMQLVLILSKVRIVIYENIKCVLVSVVSGYITTQHSSNIPLQKQLEHANQQSGFNDEKYKLQQVGHIIVSLLYFAVFKVIKKSSWM